MPIRRSPGRSWRPRSPSSAPPGSAPTSMSATAHASRRGDTIAVDNFLGPVISALPTIRLLPKGRAPMSALLLAAVFLLSGAMVTEVQAGEPTVTLVEGKLSLEAQDVPLSEVLIKIGEAAKARVLIESILASEVAKDRVSMSFTQLPIDDALRRLLRGRNFILSYGATGVDEIRVYVDGKTGFREVTTSKPGPAAMPRPGPGPAAPPSAGASDDAATAARLRRTALSSPDAAARVEAFEELADVDDDKLVVDTVVQALARERDSKVLEALIEVVQQKRDLIPPEALRAFVTSDRDGAARAQALEVLADRVGPDAATRSLLRTLARNDSSRAVREAAQDLLEGMEDEPPPRQPAAGPRRPDGAPTPPKQGN